MSRGSGPHRPHKVKSLQNSLATPIHHLVLVLCLFVTCNAPQVSFLYLFFFFLSEIMEIFAEILERAFLYNEIQNVYCLFQGKIHEFVLIAKSQCPPSIFGGYYRAEISLISCILQIFSPLKTISIKKLSLLKMNFYHKKLIDGALKESLKTN